LHGAARVHALEKAADVLGDSEEVLEHARALTELGLALRHARRRRAAREPLRQALALSDDCGALALAERARAELLAAGARPRRSALSGVKSLTQRELEVARRAAEGKSNREVANSLFVTVKTVEWHLSHVFHKLDVSSRRQLAHVLGTASESS
jgi:DNA-binding CsgD family transcriptional regulator